MSAVLKIIFGSMVRHWLSALLALVAVRIGLHPDDSAAAVGAVSNDMVYNAVVALGAAALPAIWSIFVRLRSKLKQRLALLMDAGTTEREVKERIEAAPLGARISATLTADPQKL